MHNHFLFFKIKASKKTTPRTQIKLQDKKIHARSFLIFQNKGFMAKQHQEQKLNHRIKKVNAQTTYTFQNQHLKTKSTQKQTLNHMRKKKTTQQQQQNMYHTAHQNKNKPKTKTNSQEFMSLLFIAAFRAFSPALIRCPSGSRRRCK